MLKNTNTHTHFLFSDPRKWGYPTLYYSSSTGDESLFVAIILYDNCYLVWNRNQLSDYKCNMKIDSPQELVLTNWLTNATVFICKNKDVESEYLKPTSVLYSPANTLTFYFALLTNTRLLYSDTL